MLNRLHMGEWYRWDSHPGPTMQELIDAGKVTAMGRVQTVVLCWVPVGTKPFQQERIPRA